MNEIYYAVRLSAYEFLVSGRSELLRPRKNVHSLEKFVKKIQPQNVLFQSVGISGAPGDALEAPGDTAEESVVRKCVSVLPSAVMMASVTIVVLRICFHSASE